MTARSPSPPAMTEPTLDSSPRRTPLWQVALVFGLLTTLYAAVSIQQYNRMDAYVFDLGFFESVIRDYALGHLPQLPLTDSTNAVLHFSPALALLAPVVILWSSPIAVLLAACEDAGNSGDDNLLTGGSLVLIVIIVVIVLVVRRRR